MHALTWTSVSSKVTMLWAILVPVLLPNVSIAQCNWKAWKEAANETVWVASFVFPSIGIDVSVALVSFPDPQYGTHMGLAEGLGMRLQKHQLHHI